MEFVIDQLTYDIYHECKLCRRRRLSYIEWCTWWVQKNETADCTNNRIVSVVIPCSLEQISLKATPLRAGPLWRARMIQIVFSWLIQAFCQPSLLQCKGNDLIVWLSSQVNTQDQYRSPTRITKKHNLDHAGPQIYVISKRGPNMCQHKYVDQHSQTSVS